MLVQSKWRVLFPGFPSSTCSGTAPPVLPAAPSQGSLPLPLFADPLPRGTVSVYWGMGARVLVPLVVLCSCQIIFSPKDVK